MLGLGVKFWLRAWSGLVSLDFFRMGESHFGIYKSEIVPCWVCGVTFWLRAWSGLVSLDFFCGGGSHFEVYKSEILPNSPK